MKGNAECELMNDEFPDQVTEAGTEMHHSAFRMD